MMIIMLSERPSWAAALSIALEIVCVSLHLLFVPPIMCSTLDFTQCTWMFTAQQYTLCGFHCTISVTLSHDTASVMQCITLEVSNYTTLWKCTLQCPAFSERPGSVSLWPWDKILQKCLSLMRNWSLSVRMLMMLLNGLKLRISVSQSSDISIKLADRCQFFNSAKKGWNLQNGVAQEVLETFFLWHNPEIPPGVN